MKNCLKTNLSIWIIFSPFQLNKLFMNLNVKNCHLFKKNFSAHDKLHVLTSFQVFICKNLSHVMLRKTSKKLHFSNFIFVQKSWKFLKNCEKYGFFEKQKNKFEIAFLWNFDCRIFDLLIVFEFSRGIRAILQTSLSFKKMVNFWINQEWHWTHPFIFSPVSKSNLNFFAFWDFILFYRIFHFSIKRT
jgi:hypothetical protein